MCQDVNNEKKNDRDVVLKLLQYEASTNVADNKGCIPLHLAAWKGDVDIVKILIHHGPSYCRVNEQNNENETALHCAAQYGHSEVVAVLLEELSDPTIRNNRSETPLDLAALYGRLQVVKMLVNAHPNLMSCSIRKHTPLHLAARNGHRSAVQVLLEAGMEVNCQTENGSALHEAALFGKMDVVRLLLETGIDANIKESQGRTALEILKEHPSQKSQEIAALIQALQKCLFPPLFFQDSKTKKSNHAVEIVPSPSFDVFSPEEEDNPYEFSVTAVTRKPCSLDISRLSAKTENAPHVTITEPELRNHGNSSTGPTPDCSPPSPDTALKNIEKVIRPQPKQRTSLFPSLEVHRPNHSYDCSEVSSSLGYASFSTSPPISPANYSIGSVEDCDLAGEQILESVGNRMKSRVALDASCDVWNMWLAVSDRCFCTG
ncbi:UNVERIFIED_CONTAM: hypothetical protein FKN15_067665 [Acipenser sinensis]